MSEKHVKRISTIDSLVNRQISNSQAARLLGLSKRQVQRLKKEAAQHGCMAVLHKNRGRRPHNATDPAIVERAVSICRELLSGYNFCHARDILAEEKDIVLSVSSLSRCLKSAGISSPQAKRRPAQHRSRPRRPYEGELAQMDASQFDWLGNAQLLHLHGAVDDATGKILGLHFDTQETFEGYCQILRQMNRDAQVPREFYTDARTVFVYDSKKKHKLTVAEELAGLTESKPQFARALDQIGCGLIIAGSPQAKGRVENRWKTLQDRLAKDLNRHGVSTIEQANAFLPSYIGYYNRKFAVPAASSDLKYLPKTDPHRFDLIFARHNLRVLDSGLSFSFQNRKYVFPSQVLGMKTPASPHDVVTVITSAMAGIQALFNGVVFSPTEIPTTPKSSIAPQDISLNRIPPPARVAYHPSKEHPWNKFPACSPRGSCWGDIFPDELSPPRGDIFPDH